MNYKNLITDEVISFTCYQKLPYQKQQVYIQVMDSPTHFVNERDDFMLYILQEDINFVMLEGLNDSSGGVYDGF